MELTSVILEADIATNFVTLDLSYNNTATTNLKIQEQLTANLC